MLILFETIKIIFFLFTIFLATVMMKGDLFLSAGTLKTLHAVLLPAYLVLIGVLIGYILALMFEETNSSYELRLLLYTRMFIIGLVLGTVFALMYIFVL